MTRNGHGEHEQSAVSVDVLALRYDLNDRTLLLAVHTRQWEPFTGEPALPGVLLTRGERLSDAARRALATKAGLAAAAIAEVGQLATYDEPNRDPRGPTLSLSMWASLHSDATLSGAAQWVDIRTVPELAFDHNRIIAESKPALAQLLWRNREFTQALTGQTFPVADAIAITKALTGQSPDRGNLNRHLRTTAGLRRTAEVRQVHGVGRPSSMWAWD